MTLLGSAFALPFGGETEEGVFEDRLEDFEPVLVVETDECDPLISRGTLGIDGCVMDG